MAKEKPLSERIGVEKVPDGEGYTIADAARKASDRLIALRQNSSPPSDPESTSVVSNEQVNTRADLGATLDETESQVRPKINPDGPVYRSAFKIYHNKPEGDS